VSSLKRAHSASRIASAGILGVVLVTLTSVGIFSYATNLYRLLASAPFEKTIRPNAENNEAIAWINAHTDPSDVLICDRDPYYYLFTGRKAEHFLPMSPGIDWARDPTPVFEILDQSKGNYLVLTDSDYEFNAFKNLMDMHPEQFLPVFKSANGRSTIYRISLASGRPQVST